MTPAEAANHLNLSSFEDLDEAVEMNVFRAKQELIQKADQMLLFRANQKRLSLQQEAAEFLGFVFPPEKIEFITVNPSVHIEESFLLFQSGRSNLLKQLAQISSFAGIGQIQEQIEVNYRQWASFWTIDLSMKQIEVKLSFMLDSMRIMQWINELTGVGIIEQKDIIIERIPADIQHEILRLQLVNSRIHL